MKQVIKNFIGSLIRKSGYNVIPLYPMDFDKEDVNIIKSVKPYTLTSPERVYALIQAVRYVVKNKIPGSIVECGVWKGGSILAVIKTLQTLKNCSKELCLFDTFEGMTKPRELDVSLIGISALERFNKEKISDDSSNWVRTPLEEVKKTLFNTGYNKNKIHFIKGKVEETIPDKAPDEISLWLNL